MFEPKEVTVKSEDFMKAFDFVLTQLGQFKLTRQEHILIGEIIKQARSIAIPPPEVVDSKETVAQKVKQELEAKK